MTGPEHYREAERLIASARGEHGDHYADDVAVVLRLEEAKIHATLALAAATAAGREAFTTIVEAGATQADSSIRAADGWDEVTA